MVRRSFTLMLIELILSWYPKDGLVIRFGLIALKELTNVIDFVHSSETSSDLLVRCMLCQCNQYKSYFEMSSDVDLDLMVREVGEEHSSPKLIKNRKCQEIVI
jgi:hypothetical protein